MSKPLKIAAIGIVAVAGLAGAALLLLDVNQFRGMIQGQLETALKRKVTLGPMRLKLFPLAVQASEVAIADDPGFSNAPFLTAKELAVRVSLPALLRKQVQVETVRVTQPAVELIKNRAGVWNFSSIGKKDADNSGSSEFTLAELLLDDGRIGLTNQQDRKPRVQYDNIDIALRDFAPLKPFTLTATVHFPEKLEAVAELKGVYDKAAGKLTANSLTGKLGGLQLTGSGEVQKENVNVQLRTANATITELARVAASFGTAFAPDMKVTGTLGADVRIQGPTSQLQYSGAIDLQQAEVNRAGWKQPVRLGAAKITLTPSELRSSPFTIESGRTKLTATVAVRDYSGKSQMDATLRTQDANLEEFINVAQAYGVSALDGIEASTGTVSLDVKLSGPTADLDYQGSGALENATLTLPSLTKPLVVKSARLRFSEGMAMLEGLQAALGGSNLKGSLKVSNFAAPRIEYQAEIDQLNVGELQQLTKATASSTPGKAKAAPGPSPLLKTQARGTLAVGKVQYTGLSLAKVRTESTLDGGILKLDPLTADLFGGAQRGAITVDLRPEHPTYRVTTKFEKVNANELMSATTNIKNILHGLLAAEADLNFAPKPNEEFARSLNGTMSLKLNDGKLSGVSLVNEMAKIAKAFGYTQKTDLVTNILGLTGSLQIQNGMATTNDLRLNYDGGALQAAGNIGLVDNSLKLKVLSILAKGITDQFGGNKIAGYMTTAMTNEKGELVIPCLVSGSTAKPLFVPDGAEFARLKVQNIASPTNITTGILGAIEAGKKGDTKGIGGSLLDMIGGRKKKEEPKKEQD